MICFNQKVICFIPNLNHATNFKPCGSRRQNFKGNSAPFRAFGAQGGAFGYSGEKEKTRKETTFGDLFSC